MVQKIQTLQYAFNRGELDPSLFARRDVAWLQSGAELVKNMIVKPQGGVLKRAGTEYVADAISHDRPSRLIKFQFSVSQAYILEFGDFCFRVFKDGGLVLYPPGHAKAGQVVVIQTPYGADVLPQLRFCQTEEIMYFAHPDHPPRKLTRYDHHDWRFDGLAFGSEADSPEGLAFTRDGKNGARYVVTALKGADEGSPSNVIACTTASGVGIGMPNTAGMNIQDCYTWLMYYSQPFPAQWNVWAMGSYSAITNMMRTTMGYSFVEVSYNSGIESRRYHRPGNPFKFEFIGPSANPDAFWAGLARDEAIGGMNNGYGGILPAVRQQIVDYVNNYNASVTATGHSTLKWDAVAGATSYQIYRETQTDNGKVFFLVGAAAGTTFDDDNLPYDPARGLPQSIEKFDGPDLYPGVCVFYEQRLVFGRTNKKPNTVWGSQIGLYSNFNISTPIKDSDSYNFTLNATEGVNEILWIVPFDDLLIGTAAGEWLMGGGNYALTPTNVNARRQSTYGCSPVQPVVVGRSAVFVTRAGNVIRDLSYSLEANGYSGKSPISMSAAHLFAGHKTRIKEMAYQQDPDSILWIVMEDGRLLSCTYMPDEDVKAFAQHETDGKFEACASLVNVDGSDEMWFVVAREVNGQTKRFIECMRKIPTSADDPADSFFVDSGLSYFGLPRDTFYLKHLAGKTVTVLGDGNVFPDLTVAADGKIVLPIKATRVTAGLPYKAELLTLDMTPDGGVIANRPRAPLSACIHLYHTSECFYGPEPGVVDEAKLRTSEAPGQPIRPHTGPLSVSVPAAKNSWRGTRVYLMSKSPVPFGVLSVTVQVALGEEVMSRAK